MLIRNSAICELHPAPTPVPPIDLQKARNLVEVCLDELPPFLRRVADAFQVLGTDLADEADCELLAFFLRLKPGTLRSYFCKIRHRCRALREEFVALHDEIR